MSNRESLSSLDTTWLRMDRPTNPMTILAVMTFPRRIAFEPFKRLIATRFLRHRRFRQRVTMQGDSAYWEDDPHFDLRFHVKRTALPSPCDRRELEELVSDLASTPLDTARPLWQYHVVENYADGCALVARIHHCYADGIALVRVLLAMADESAGEYKPHTQPDAAQREPGLIENWLSPVTSLLSQAAGIGSSVLTTYSDLLLHPAHAIEYAQRGAEITAEAARLAVMPNDSCTSLKGKPSGVKRVAWSNAISLDEVKALAKALQCSVNDLLMSAVAGALRSYLLAKQESLHEVEIRVLVPVNLRPADEDPSLGNYFGLVALLLPLGIDNPLERLYEIQRRMQALKGSSQAAVTLGLLATVGAGPKVLQQQVLDMLANRATAVLTNVPGPQQAIQLAGIDLKEIIFWVPQSGDIGMGISILSYAGGVQFGIIVDQQIVSEPHDITDQFANEFEQLMLITIMSPWETQPTVEFAEQLLNRG